MELVGHDMMMTVNNHYKVVQEVQDRAQEVVEQLECGNTAWREQYIELMRDKWEAEEQRDKWRVLAFEQSARVFELEAELEQLKKGMGA